MKKNSIRGGILLFVSVALYNIVVFLVPFAKTGTFWVAYVYTLVAFVVVAIALYIAFFRKMDARSSFYGFPVARLGIIYGIIQLITSLVAMSIATRIPPWIAVIIFSIIFGGTVMGLVSLSAVVEQIENMDERQKRDVSMMTTIHSNVKMMSTQCDDQDMVRLLSKFAEEIEYSDPVSSAASAGLETELYAMVDMLQQAVMDGEQEKIVKLCRKATELLFERNRICKMYKN